ncbi:MAG TPA: hypothetical protein VJP85_12815 [Candidatus Baltobacteraceae bacterium]|nr:hypothetical protein [Candidatus Baltobacteraceae bacterium]
MSTVLVGGFPVAPDMFAKVTGPGEGAVGFTCMITLCVAGEMYFGVRARDVFLCGQCITKLIAAFTAGFADGGEGNMFSPERPEHAAKRMLTAVMTPIVLFIGGPPA